MKNRLYRAAGLVTAMLLTSVATLPARAVPEQVADGTVNFTGEMLGATTCTLENNSLTVDFGTIYVNRKGAVPANPLTQTPKTVAFRLTKCASNIQKVNMTVDFEYVSGDNSLIRNTGGSARNVAGVLVCPAEAPAQGVNCTAGNRFSNGETVSGTVTNGGVSFPLTVSLVTFNPLVPAIPHMPQAGDINMTVNFTFEEE
ncbi:type 1 fimbrial protein [Salmonella enterica]|nr:type 1 fimbrial protein [Salmonella enterica]EIR0330908.1 type 1 fimbrial protein [Salmonella enterica subsp. enterica serovar Give]